MSQVDDLAVWSGAQLLVEASHDVDRTSAPAEDRLAMISDRRQPPVCPDEPSNDAILDLVHVLHFVGDDVAPAASRFGAGVGAVQEAKELRLGRTEIEKASAAHEGVEACRGYGESTRFGSATDVRQ